METNTNKRYATKKEAMEDAYSFQRVVKVVSLFSTSYRLAINVHPALYKSFFLNKTYTD
jgi:hypothetical protein